MDDQIAQFVSLTSSTPQEAQSYLTQAGGNLETAVGLFFAAADDGDDAGEEDQLMADEDDSGSAPPQSHSAPSPAAATPATRTGGGGNSMGGGASEPLPAGWGQGGGGGSGARVGRVGQWGGPGGQGSTPARTGNGPRIATLGSINSSGPSAGGPPGGDDDESSDEEKGEDLYAGGERSGLNIQNPNKNKGPAGAGGGRGVVADILKKAQEAGPPPTAPGAAGPSSSSAPSWGSGNTLGSDTTPSSSIADPNAPPARGGEHDDEEDDEEEEVAVRHLTFWKDGFSIEDGELRRYDQPGNRELLEAINQGRAPPSLLNVRVNQPVEVRVAKRLDEDWKPAPPKPKGPWEGSGNRLGAPVPGLASPTSASSTPALPAATATEASSTTGTGSSAGGNLQFEVDMTEPTTQLQIRLGDGTRLVARVNFTHTIGDVRRFINASRPSSTRSYALQTTFPNKDLADESQTIKEAGLGGAVVVQRWI
ncbi:hypothetical protein BDY24DRAFT_390192 [Mrakia frigida]|uniref:UBX domain-containing protein n=1 Tax=Mrakia frigida TaxID=29902 RepID=UPI003FCC1C94